MTTVNSMKALRRVVKATKGATDTILYSEHATNVHRHRYAWPRSSTHINMYLQEQLDEANETYSRK